MTPKVTSISPRVKSPTSTSAQKPVKKVEKPVKTPKDSANKTVETTGLSEKIPVKDINKEESKSTSSSNQKAIFQESSKKLSELDSQLNSDNKFK